MKPSIVLLYGLDETSHGFEVAATRTLVGAAHTALAVRGWRVESVRVEHDLVEVMQPYAPDEWIVLNLCEGAPSQVFYYAKTARVLSAMGYTFTGSDHVSLDHTQYKWKMKSLLNRHNVPTPVWGIYDRAGDVTAERLPIGIFPAIVKPAGEHCSYGITRDSVVMNVAEARAQAAQVIDQFDGPALIEEFLDSAEYNVSVWGSQRANAGVLGISTMTYGAFADIRDRLCTFEAKWDPASEPYRRIPAICPAPISAVLKAEIEEVSVAAYLASGVRDYGRIDLRLRNGRPMVLDVNANCDVSPDGGFATAAAVAGLSYGQMMERILEFALERWHAAAEVLPVGDVDAVRAPMRRELVTA